MTVLGKDKIRHIALSATVRAGSNSFFLCILFLAKRVY